MKNTNQNKIKSPQFKDVSRYTRWMNRLDRSDESLSPSRRKTKWVLFLGILFLFFALSFILFPSEKFKHQKLHDPAPDTERPAYERPASPFEMPVDSFENLLKRRLDERIPEEK